MDRPPEHYWVEQLRDVFRAVDQSPTTKIPDSPTGLLGHHEFHDGYLYPQQAEVVAALDAASGPLSISELAGALEWSVCGAPDHATTATFLQEPIREGRVLINDDDTFTLVW
jgi:hypothetical protein